MDELYKLGVKKWFRYADDVFATLILEYIYINKTHPNIKFSIEHENAQELPFLDTLLKRRINR